MAAGWVSKSIRRKHILAVAACVGVMMMLALYQFGVSVSKEPSHPHHHHVPYEDVRKDAGQPAWLDAVRRDGLTHGLADVNLNNMTRDQLFLTLHSYLDNTDVICLRKLRMGHVDEGGWEVCDDPDVRPVAPCLVYSYGINNDWSFDDDVSKLYGCHVFSFDPSLSLDTHNRSRLVHFYKLGISGWRTASKKWRLYSHQELRALLGHEAKAVDIIKMDVENAEWGALDDMIKADQFKDVKQLFVEFHLSKKSSLLRKLKVIRSLEVAGFKRFYVHKNKNCRLRDPRIPIRRTFCYEVHYIKR